MITFGEVVNYDEAQYVFLAATEKIIYLAKILNSHEAKRVNNLCAKRQSDGQLAKVENSPLYCFVILSTDNFKDRMAHLGSTGHDFISNLVMDIIGRLNGDDLREIKKTIITGPVPTELKELVRDLAVETN